MTRHQYHLQTFELCALGVCACVFVGIVGKLTQFVLGVLIAVVRV